MIWNKHAKTLDTSRLAALGLWPHMHLSFATLYIIPLGSDAMCVRWPKLASTKEIIRMIDRQGFTGAEVPR